MSMNEMRQSCLRGKLSHDEIRILLFMLRWDKSTLFFRDIRTKKRERERLGELAYATQKNEQIT